MPALKANTPQGERKKKRKWDKRRNCASNTLCCMCFLFGPLASVTVICDPLPNAPQKKKKKRRGKKKDPAMFFPACWKWAQSCQEEVCRPFPGAEEWRGSYATWGRYGGGEKGEGPWLPASPGLSSLDGSVVLPHRWRLAHLSLSPPAPQASHAYQLCTNTRAAHGKTVPATCGLQLEQWFITNYRRRYREMCVNAVQHEWSRLQLMKLWWNRRKKNCQRVRKGVRNLSFAYQKCGIFKYFTNFVNYYKIKKNVNNLVICIGKKI